MNWINVQANINSYPLSTMPGIYHLWTACLPDWCWGWNRRPLRIFPNLDTCSTTELHSLTLLSFLYSNVLPFLPSSDNAEINQTPQPTA